MPALLLPLTVYTLQVMPHALPFLHQASPSFSACAVHQQSWFSECLVGGRVLPLHALYHWAFVLRRKEASHLPGGRKEAGISPASTVFPPLSPPCPLPICSISTSDHSEGLQSLSGSPRSVHLPRCLLVWVVMTTSPELFSFWGKCWVLLLGVQSFHLFSDCTLHVEKGLCPWSKLFMDHLHQVRGSKMPICLTMPASATPVVKSR